MINFKRPNTCIYNPIYTKFNEDISQKDYLYYDLKYPTFYNFKNPYFYIDPNILENINSTIKLDTYTFKDGVLKEQNEFNNSNPQGKKNYKAFVNYFVTFNKNYILSSTLSLMGLIENDGILYNQLNNYNFDLLTGEKIHLKDVFNNIDYIKLITNYVNYKINQNKNLYHENISINIPEDQSFYLTDNSIVIYFELGQIAPKEFGIPKFKMSFLKFMPFINPRFYCIATNVDYRKFTPFMSTTI